ncbi:MAG: 16S rRNA (guanine(527)-N(7))-methyltransferase RsmG [Sphingomonadaceae bacterium]|nr:16S rRNA (guanine(527)-N(7))-methyltransferase RsmG [Sphingomonadaceae bacterium]
MTEEQAKLILRTQFGVSRETEARLEQFVDLLTVEAQKQNLISATTVGAIWSRHILDSAQLLQFLSHTNQTWLDLGSGAGFPGLVIALLSPFKVTLVESRARRIDYLRHAVAVLGLPDVTVAGAPLERLETAPYSVISARAFAPLPRLFALASRFSTDKTLWLLPKGRNAAKEWMNAQAEWAGDFRIEPSLTDADAGILVGHLTGKRCVRASRAGTRHEKR